MDPNPPPTHGQPYSNITPPQTSGAAIVSLVLGCAAFITVGFTAIPAVVFGHIALHRIGKSAGRLTGSGMAVAGLILGYLFSVLFLIAAVAILAGLALPVFAAVQEKGLQTKGLSQLRQVGVACQIYAIDHDGKFPAKLDDLVPEQLPDASLLLCPYPDAKSPKPFEYFGGSKSDPSDQVLAASPAVPNKGRLFLYIDGSAKAKSRATLKLESGK